MKAWRDLSEVETPKRIQRLPCDARGYPIPANVLVTDGVPDFRTIDPDKIVWAVQYKRCAICGEPLGSHVAFVGGPRSIKSRWFSDAPMHRDCAVYALQVCPFLAAPSFGYRKSVPEDATVNLLVSTERPEVFGLGITRGYEPAVHGGHLLLHAAPFESLSWWKGGHEVPAGQEQPCETS